MSVYAAVAALFVDSRPKGVPGRGTAVLGAVGALALALAFQVTAHLIAAGGMGSSPFLVAAVSAVPPVVVAHIMHMVAGADVAAQVAVSVATADCAVEVAEGQEVELGGQEVAELGPVAVHAASQPADPSVVAAGPLPEVEVAVDGAVAVVSGHDGDRAELVDGHAAVATVDGGHDDGHGRDRTLEELEPVVAVAAEVAVAGHDAGPSWPGSGRVTASGRGRSVEEIRVAVAKLKASGQEVTGTTYAALVGVSGRTARRDLQALKAA
ncbi:hypothetical protein [Streptomyces sp. MNP-20]|uniref:hypothetical protein n=1 Tax=Streptomyces sp. MNP-20 TaxID=2721165 RepID=UPI0026573C73|nr:hypothetical protein [Streptomyces sp. MNP-20]